jgi:Restriction endonuclease fold toxin 5
MPDRQILYGDNQGRPSLPGDRSNIPSDADVRAAMRKIVQASKGEAKLDPSGDSGGGKKQSTKRKSEAAGEKGAKGEKGAETRGSADKGKVPSDADVRAAVRKMGQPTKADNKPKPSADSGEETQQPTKPKSESAGAKGVETRTIGSSDPSKPEKVGDAALGAEASTDKSQAGSKQFNLADAAHQILLIKTAEARNAFITTTGQTPERFVTGMIDKAKSLTVDPVVTIYGPGGMLDKAARKGINLLQGKGGQDYVTKEEHDNQLQAIAQVIGFLFPGTCELGNIGNNPKIATGDGTLAAVAVDGTSNGMPIIDLRGGSAKPDATNEDKEESGGTKADSSKREPGKPVETGHTNMKPEQARYQKQITGKPASKTYEVSGVSFDGYKPDKVGNSGTLLEAKHLGDEGRFAKAYQNMLKGNYSDVSHLVDRGNNLLEQARSQVAAADGTGARIEWRVSGKNAANALRTMFDHYPEIGDRISVRYEPLARKPL